MDNRAGMGSLYISLKERLNLTSIILKVNGAHAWAKVCGTLTSGMVGLPVTIDCDESWEGLTKNLVCRCSTWDDQDVEIRTILNVGETATVAHEVMKAGMRLHLGLEGFREDGTLVIPTTWATCKGTIHRGANSNGDPGTDPELPVWNQLQAQIEQINREGITQERMEEIRSCAETAAHAATQAERSEQNAVAASHFSINNSNAAKSFADEAKASEENARASASSAANIANGALQAQRAAEAAAQRAEAAAGLSENPGLTAAQIGALDGLLRLAKYESDPAGAYAAFCDAFGITAKTLVNISAVYTGGEVASGTALTELDGITVTATYSDGSTAVVNGYTLSGEITEGSNAITVTYGGKTATITVVGVAAGEEPVAPLFGTFWPPMNKITNWDDPEWDGVDNLAPTRNSGQYIDAGFPTGAYLRLDKLQGTLYIRTLSKEQYGQLTAFKTYSLYANNDGEIATGGFQAINPVIHRQFGGKTQTMEVDGITYYFVLFEFNIPVGQVGYFISQANAMTNGYFLTNEERTAIRDEYRPYYTLFGFDPSGRITEPATEVV